MIASYLFLITLIIIFVVFYFLPVDPLFKVFGVQAIFQTDIPHTCADQFRQMGSALKRFADVTGQGTDIRPLAAHHADSDRRFRIVQTAFKQLYLINNKLLRL